jgi:hypothetical protein
MRTAFFAAAIVSCLGLPAHQAPPAHPTVIRPFQLSPAASVSQDLGVSNVRIDYHRPAVKGRKIWGGLVPYGQVWRAGANEATAISFSDPVRIDGKDLPAGTYAFFAIPGKDEWTLIFNREARQWGAFNYHAGQDALRIQVKPAVRPAQEYLGYTIQVTAPERLRVELAWENLAVGFDLAMEVQASYWAYLTRTLAGAGPDEWQPLNQAAGYCLASGTHLDRAMDWVDQSLRIKEGFKNLELKARLLQRSGRTPEAIPFLDRALEQAAAAKAAPSYLAELEQLHKDWE